MPTADAHAPVLPPALSQACAGFEAHLLDAVGTGLSPAMSEAIDLLTGKRELNIRQVRALSERFGVSAATFV